MLKIFFIFFFFVSSATAIEFEEIESFTVSGKQGKGIFHHLESGGRKSIAINNDYIGIVWEDNSNGQNTIYFVGKKKQAEPSAPTILSAIGYLPVISTMDKGFIVAWEDDTSTQIVYINLDGTVIDTSSLGDKQERQVSFDTTNTGLLATWIAGNYRASEINTAIIKIVDKKVTINDRRSVDTASPPLSKEYPTILDVGDGDHVVSWQDRRTKTNVLRYSLFHEGKYTAQKEINATVQKSEIFGMGSSAIRGTLAIMPKGNILAVWMDKRSVKSGYEVFSSISKNNGRTFSGNIKVQDTFGNELPQWNASIVKNDNYGIVIWNDGREDDQDIYYSYKVDNKWSDDVMIELSSVEWDQYAPQAVLDADNDLHLVWIDKVWLDTVTFETSIKYSRLKMSTDN